MDEKIRFILGIFGLLFISDIMTIFELVFYINIVEPVINNNINGLLNSLTNNIKLNNHIKNLDNIMNVFILREEELIYKINFGSYLVIIFEIIIITCILCYIYLYIKSMSKNFKLEEHFKPVIISSLFVIFVLIFFQILFFNFSLRYEYIGKYGLDEIKAKIIKKIQSNYEL